MSLWGTRGERAGTDADSGRSRSRATEPRPGQDAGRAREEGATVANIGKSITIKGDVFGSEDLVIDGRVEGRIDLKDHHLTIGPNGEVPADISGKQVTIVGHVAGNVTAVERVEVRESGRIEGDITAPRLLIHEGAQVNGAISMRAPGATAAAPRPKPLAQAPSLSKQVG
jgi:cytoskeletal protein CcmA (bactofilin family)